VGNEVALNKAVVLDRDGTIAPDVPYCSRPEDFNLFPEVPEAIAVLNNEGFKVVVVTNQSGLARGYFKEETLSQIHHKMEAELAGQNAKLDGIYYCPHHPDDGCDCRKPNIALFLKAVEDINIDYKSSYVIGDMELDIIAGKKMGCKTILINHGNGNSVRHTTKPDYVASDMLDAANWILSNG
jgi:histidinol-phosphate phosphatase family protein